MHDIALLADQSERNRHLNKQLRKLLFTFPQFSGSVLHLRFNPAGMTGTQQQQRAQQTGTQDPDTQHPPALPALVLFKVGRGRCGFQTISTRTKAEAVFE